jgi:hypothetical protein
VPAIGASASEAPPNQIATVTRRCGNLVVHCATVRRSRTLTTASSQLTALSARVLRRPSANSATLRCEPLASKQTLGPAIGRRFPYVAVSAVSIRLPLAAEGSTADDVVSDGIDYRTLWNRCRSLTREGSADSGAPAVSCLDLSREGERLWAIPKRRLPVTLRAVPVPLVGVVPRYAGPSGPFEARSCQAHAVPRRTPDEP